MATFAETLATLPPINNGTVHARGFLPPMIRAMGHLIWVATKAQAPDTDQAALKTDIDAAFTHWNEKTVPEGISTTLQNRLTALNEVMLKWQIEYDEWPPAVKATNTVTLANQIVAVTALLDRELVGIANSHHGANL